MISCCGRREMLVEDSESIAKLAGRCCHTTCPECGEMTRLYCASYIMGGSVLTFRCECGVMLRMMISGMMIGGERESSGKVQAPQEEKDQSLGPGVET